MVRNVAAGLRIDFFHLIPTFSRFVYNLIRRLRNLEGFEWWGAARDKIK